MKFNLKEVFNTATKSMNEHKPELLTGTGIALMLIGTAGAIIATVKTMQAATDKKEEKLKKIAANSEEYAELSEEEQQEYDGIVNSPVSAKEVAPVCWKWWMIPALADACGILCIILSDREQGKRLASAAAALAFHVAESKDYKEAAKDILGEKKEKEIDEEAAKRNVKHRSTPSNYELLPVHGTACQKYQEYYSGKKFWADPNYIRSCLNALNERILDARDSCEEMVKLYEWFDILGIDRAGCGEDLGFDVANGTVDISASNANAYIDEDGVSCIIIRFNYPPVWSHNY